MCVCMCMWDYCKNNACAGAGKNWACEVRREKMPKIQKSKAKFLPTPTKAQNANK